jgi:hypothetical protein
MKIEQMEKSKERGPKWTAVLTDTRGSDSYELAIRGPKALVGRVFEKSNFEIEIDPDASAETAQTRLAQLFAKYSVTAKDPFVDPGHNPFKKPTARIDEAKSVIVSVRRTRGKGTLWALFFPLLWVPAGANLFFILPPVSFCHAAVFPVVGDPDLFLTLNSPLPPTVAMSKMSLTAIDSVTFGVPGLPGVFVPFFRVNGFTTGVTGFFMFGF